jgi:hypothetical protein
MTRGLAQVLDDYVAAWNEPDADARERLLAACVTDAVVMAPGYAPEAPVISGREALSAEIGTMIARRPAGRGFRLARIGELSAHHGWARFGWRVVDADGAVLTVGGAQIAGLDVVRAADDGRLDQMIVFFGDAQNSAESLA